MASAKRGEKQGIATSARAPRASQIPLLPSLLAPATQAKMAPMSYSDPRPLFLFTTRGHEVRPRAILCAPEEREGGWVRLFANPTPLTSLASNNNNNNNSNNNNNNNNKLYLHDYNKVLKYCTSHLKFNY